MFQTVEVWTGSKGPLRSIVGFLFLFSVIKMHLPNAWSLTLCCEHAGYIILSPYKQTLLQNNKTKYPNVGIITSLFSQFVKSNIDLQTTWMAFQRCKGEKGGKEKAAFFSQIHSKFFPHWHQGLVILRRNRS